MSKAEKFIQENTKDCSNLLYRDCIQGSDKIVYQPWRTPDQARKAVEIAKEEIYEWLEEYAANFVSLADDEHKPIGDTKAFYGTKSLVLCLRQVMSERN